MQNAGMAGVEVDVVGQEAAAAGDSEILRRDPAARQSRVGDVPAVSGGLDGAGARVADVSRIVGDSIGEARRIADVQGPEVEARQLVLRGASDILGSYDIGLGKAGGKELRVAGPAQAKAGVEGIA